MWVSPGKRSTQETRREPAHGVLGIGFSVRRLCSDSINLDSLSLNAHEPTIGRTGTHLRRYSNFSVRYSKVVQAKSNQNLLSYCANEGCAFCRKTLHELTPRSNDVPKRDVAIPSNPRVPSSPCLALRQYYYDETVTFPPHQMLKGLCRLCGLLPKPTGTTNATPFLELSATAHIYRDHFSRTK